MIYKNTIQGIFIQRPNRFIAIVEIDGIKEAVHVKNTGRCKELLLPGGKVILSRADNPNRKTDYDLISVYKKGLGWVNIDSGIPNQLIKEWLNSQDCLFSDINLIHPEYKYGNSRIDFYIENKQQPILIEVKGCTLEIDGVGYFPDAPTLRGVKHLQELAKAAKSGYECYIAFVIAMANVTTVYPNTNTHMEFKEALDLAVEQGVKVLYLTCDVKPDEIFINSYHF